VSPQRTLRSDPRDLERPRDLGDELVDEAAIGDLGIPGVERELPSAEDLDLPDLVSGASGAIPLGP